MTSRYASAIQTKKSGSLRQEGPILILIVAASFCLAANWNKGIVFESACVLATVLAPFLYMASRRIANMARQKKTEESIMQHTLTYFRQGSATHTPAVPTPRAGVTWVAGFQHSAANATPNAMAGDLAVFGAIVGHTRARGMSPRIPGLATVRFGDLAPEAKPPSEFGCWKDERQPFRIEYAWSVLDEIRIAAVDGYQRLRHGGVEVGGVLFGTHSNGIVRILAVRPIGCEYAHGPRFTLSERDQAALVELLQAPRQDTELQGLEPVGWYHSHTRSEIFLSELDIEYCNRFFPLSWQVALVVRPASLAPVRAGFFFREADGAIHTESSYSEFQLSPPARVVAAA